MRSKYNLLPNTGASGESSYIFIFCYYHVHKNKKRLVKNQLKGYKIVYLAPNSLSLVFLALV